jgi:hypothetical protein
MEQSKAKDNSLRKNGTSKSTGFFGAFKTLDGTNRDMTEFSVGVDLGSGEVEIPSVVPTLTRVELDYLRSGNDPSNTIVKKAILHARERIAQGKSPFWGKGEEVYKIPAPERNTADNLERILIDRASQPSKPVDAGLATYLKGQ